MTVSVVIPAYGHRDFIVLALESVFSQTFRDFEVIVVNDGSPDDTESVLSPWIASGRIRYVSQPNAGQGSARNRGISVARGEFVALLDDDDLWPSDKLSWQVQALRDHPEAAVVYGFPEPIGLDGTTVEPRDWYGDILPWPWTAPQGKMYAPLCARCWLVSPGQALVRRSALDALTGSGDAGPFDTGLGGSDDWDLWLRLSEAWEFVFEERPALRYRLHGGNASRNTIQMRENGLAVYRKHLRRHAADPERRAVIAAWYDFLRRDTPRYLLRQAYRDRARGDIAMALRKLRYAFRHEPRLLGEGDAWKFFLVTLLRARQDGASIARRDQDWHGQRQEQK
jgi:glycosyltransferase involved in cell wall biosynthesis